MFSRFGSAFEKRKLTGRMLMLLKGKVWYCSCSSLSCCCLASSMSLSCCRWSSSMLIPLSSNLFDPFRRFAWLFLHSSKTLDRFYNVFLLLIQGIILQLYKRKATCYSTAFNFVVDYFLSFSLVPWKGTGKEKIEKYRKTSENRDYSTGINHFRES